jgi:hypothetical protein
MMTTTRKSVLLAAALLCLVPSSDAFFSAKPAKSKVSGSPLAEEAAAVFDKKFPFGREPPKPNPLGDFGMPNQGTLIIINAILQQQNIVHCLV